MEQVEPSEIFLKVEEFTIYISNLKIGEIFLGVIDKIGFFFRDDCSKLTKLDLLILGHLYYH